MAIQIRPHLLDAVQSRYPAVSLSVSPDNPAQRLYQRLGFEAVGTSGSSLTLVEPVKQHFNRPTGHLGQCFNRFNLNRDTLLVTEVCARGLDRHALSIPSPEARPANIG